MIISVFLKWLPGISGISTDNITGLLGIIILLSGIFIAFVGANKAFNMGVSLPEQVLGFSMDQLAITAGVPAFLWPFGLIGLSGLKFGAHLAWIGAAVAIAGAVMSSRSSSPASSAGPVNI